MSSNSVKKDLKYAKEKNLKTNFVLSFLVFNTISSFGSPNIEIYIIFFNFEVFVLYLDSHNEIIIKRIKKI